MTLKAHSLEKLESVLLESVARTQKRELLVKGMSFPRIKAGGYNEGRYTTFGVDPGRGTGVPDCVSSSRVCGS
jgi:hypothetical protein